MDVFVVNWFDFEICRKSIPDNSMMLLGVQWLGLKRLSPGLSRRDLLAQLSIVVFRTLQTLVQDDIIQFISIQYLSIPQILCIKHIGIKVTRQHVATVFLDGLRIINLT